MECLLVFYWSVLNHFKQVTEHVKAGVYKVHFKITFKLSFHGTRLENFLGTEKITDPYFRQDMAVVTFVCKVSVIPTGLFSNVSVTQFAYRCKMTNKFVKELVGFINVFQFTPTCFGKLLPSPGVICALEAARLISVLWAYTVYDRNPCTPTTQILLK
jgi:hypothetical protein